MTGKKSGNKILVAIVAFVVIVLAVVIAAGQFLGPKVVDVQITSCIAAVSGPLEFREGDTIIMSVVSDTADEIHVHGYDIEDELVPGEKKQLSFKATVKGSFEVELHGCEEHLFELVVS